MSNFEEKVDQKIENVTSRIDEQVDQFGNRIDNIVQSAVDACDFSNLSNKITSAVDQGVDEIHHTLYGEPRKNGAQARNGKPRRDLFARTAGLQVPGMVCLIIGIILAVIFGISEIVVIGIMAASRGGTGAIASVVVFVILLIFLIVGIFLIVYGSREMKLAQHFKKYVSFLAEKTWTKISDLAYAVNFSEKSVLKDVRRMIHKHWFKEGHLDSSGQILMLTDEIWKEYCNESDARQRMMREEQEKRRKNAQAGARNPKVEQVLNEGEELLKELRACNDAIPQKEISEKISRMEQLTQKIFDRVREKPEQVDEIRKLMKYYLPTALKLLHAYDELNRQTVQGDNIINSKKEIEEAIDTLNAAFEKLLDNLFQDTAWDVSSDISVLNTMLSQEGLKDDGAEFRK